MATTVLIVDDHPTFRSLARRLLRTGGYDVVGEAADYGSRIETCGARGFVSKAELSEATLEAVLH